MRAASIHLSPPLPSVTCSPQSCSRWRPYSNSNDMEANAAIIIIILLCALICALALNAAIRCFLRGSGDNPVDHQDLRQRKPEVEATSAALAAAPTVTYRAGMKLAAAEAECAICLTELVEGEVIRMMERCRHGFHVECIGVWLSSHSSCPTCRRSCLALPTHASLPPPL